MSISSIAASTATTTPGSVTDAAQTLVLKKAINQQAANAATLLDSLPAPAPLPMSGSVGRTINTTA